MWKLFGSGGQTGLAPTDFPAVKECSIGGSWLSGYVAARRDCKVGNWGRKMGGVRMERLEDERRSQGEKKPLSIDRSGPEICPIDLLEEYWN